MREQDIRKLDHTDRTLALQILNPDPDDKTALKLAIEQQSPRSFEVMVEMLKGFPELCLSRMMLKALGLIFSSQSISVLNFFEQSFFRPPQMEIEQFIPWNNELKELIFPCHTSVMSQKLLIE